MRTFRNIFWGTLFAVSAWCVIAQGNTTDAGKLIRIFLCIIFAYMFFTRSSWGAKVVKLFNFKY